MKRLLLAMALILSLTSPCVAADNPWAGTWMPDPARSNFVEVKGPLVISVPSEGVLRWEYPSIGFRMEGKPDGREMSLTLPNMPKGLKETVTMLTPTKLTYASYLDDKRTLISVL